MKLEYILSTMGPFEELRLFEVSNWEYVVLVNAKSVIYIFIFPKKLLDFVWFWRRYFEFDLFPLCIRRENPSPRMKCQEIGVSSNLKNLRRIELEDWQQQRLQECIMGKRGSKHFFSILAIRKRTKVSFFWDLSQDISSSGL